MEAGAAELVLLDQADGEAELDRAQCGRVSAASSTENDKVKVLLGHPATPLCIRSCAYRPGIVCRRGRREGKDFLAAYDPTTRREKLLGQSEQGAHGHAGRSRSRARRTPLPPLLDGPAMSRCAHGIAARPRLRRALPTKSLQEQRRRAASRRPCCRSWRWRCRRRRESSIARSSAGSGIGHSGLAGARAAADDRAATSVVVAHDGDVAARPGRPRAAPVSVATSTIASGCSSLAATSPSASTRRPSASVLSTSTVLPPRMRSTSFGRIAEPDGMFSAMHSHAVMRTGRPSRAAASSRRARSPRRSCRTSCRPWMPAGFSERPPESKVMPLPTRARCFVAPPGE